MTLICATWFLWCCSVKSAPLEEKPLGEECAVIGEKSLVGLSQA
jgi:hypothetical protein